MTQERQNIDPVSLGSKVPEGYKVTSANANSDEVDIMKNKPYTQHSDWREEFKENMPKDDDSLMNKNESDAYFFGYKYFGGDTIHTVTDWGNIMKFIASEKSKSYEEGIRKAIEVALKSKCLDGRDTHGVGGLLKKDDVVTELNQLLK